METGEPLFPGTLKNRRGLGVGGGGWRESSGRILEIQTEGFCDLWFSTPALGQTDGFPVQARAHGSLQRPSGALQSLLCLLEEVLVAAG